MAKKEANTKKENNKNKKSFFKGLKAELKKVNWPTPKQLVNNTAAVLVIVFITAAIVFVLDIVFESMNKHGVDKIKSVVTTQNNVEEGATVEDGTEATENTEEATQEGNAQVNSEESTTGEEATTGQENTENNTDASAE